MTQIEVLLLSLLHSKDCHGYEFEQTIEKENLRTWMTIGFSSIYNSLNKLEKNNYIVSRLEKGNGSPNRKVYSIKDEARKLIEENIFKMISEYKRDASDFKLALNFSHILSSEKLNEALTFHKQALIERKEDLIEEYKKKMNEDHTLQRKWLVERSVSLLDTDIVWIDKCIKETSKQIS